MKYEQEAKTIVQLVGGENNINSLVHCATRLRFELKNEGKVKKEELKNLPYVLQVVQSGGQCQVVIGPAVSDYFDAVLKVANIKGNKSEGDSSEDGVRKKINLDAILKVISGAFSPLIPLLAGAGMVKALLTVLTTAHIMSDASSTYAILSAAGNAVFYFMPIFLGLTLAKQFGANPYVGAAIGAALLEPSFSALIDVEGTNFLGINVTAINYSATIFPIFIAMMVYALLEKGLKKIIKKELQLFLVPMICLMVMVPFTVIVFGPFGTSIGNAVSEVVSWLFDFNGTIAGIVLGATYPYLTILGLHWGFTPITLQNLEMYGGDVIEGVAVCAVYAQIGIAIGAYLKGRKGSKIRGVAGPNILTGLFAGVTEPILYGIVMEYKRLFAVVAIAAGIGGAINGTFGVTCDAYVFHNIFSAGMMTYSPFGFFILGILASVVSGALLTYFWGIRKEDMQDFEAVTEVQQKSVTEVKLVDIAAPVNGEIIPLEKVEDEVFASGVSGKGVAVKPAEDVIKAPCNGTVTVVFPSKHAVGLKTEEGIDLLLHIGLNTVMLEGRGFESLVKEGEQVAVGTPLIRFDRKVIEESGYSLVSPILVTNPEEVKDIIIEEKNSAVCGESLYQVMV